MRLSVTHRSLLIFIFSWLPTGCGKHHQHVDLFGEFIKKSPWGVPACPEIRYPNDQSFSLRETHVFFGQPSQESEITPSFVEDEKVVASLWTPPGDKSASWTVQCQYHHLDKIVEITLPRSTRYCVSMLFKETPPLITKNYVFWCVPSPIQDWLNQKNIKSYHYNAFQ